jgi:hypothetical protein
MKIIVFWIYRLAVRQIGNSVSETPTANIFNSVIAELNPICHLLALLGAHHILHVSRIRVNVEK